MKGKVDKIYRVHLFNLKLCDKMKYIASKVTQCNSGS